MDQHTSDLIESSSHDPAIESPRGTLAIVVIFGVLFALTWVAIYFSLFMERGAPHHH